jgi:hypothetical protein
LKDFDGAGQLGIKLGWYYDGGWTKSQELSGRSKSNFSTGLATKDHSPFVIRYSSLVIRHSLFVTRYSSPVIRHPLFVTRYSSLVIRHFGTIAHMAWLF